MLPWIRLCSGDISECSQCTGIEGSYPKEPRENGMIKDPSIRFSLAILTQERGHVYRVVFFLFSFFFSSSFLSPLIENGGRGEADYRYGKVRPREITFSEGHKGSWLHWYAFASLLVCYLPPEPTPMDRVCSSDCRGVEWLLLVSGGGIQWPQTICSPQGAKEWTHRQWM